jgi:hypothetical protein
MPLFGIAYGRTATATIAARVTYCSIHQSEMDCDASGRPIKLHNTFKYLTLPTI